MHMNNLKLQRPVVLQDMTKLSVPNINHIQESSEHLYCVTEFKTECLKKWEYIVGTGLQHISQRSIFLVQVRQSM